MKGSTKGAATLSLGALLLAASCGSTESTHAAGPCREDADCTSTQWCDNGVCRPLQSDGGMVGDSQVPGCLGANTSPSAGKNCGCSFDCDVGELCFDEKAFGIPGGVCNRGCGEEPCPAGLECTPLETGGSVCSIPCETAADCPQGSLCRPRVPGGKFVCTEHCHADSDCPLVGTCDRYTGECTTTPTGAGLGAVGDPCQTPNECRSGQCFTESVGPPGGYCTALCAPSQQGCPDGAFCVLATDGGKDYGGCFKTCQNTQDCRPGYTCVTAPDASVCF
jgi:hypothetical protein